MKLTYFPYETTHKLSSKFYTRTTTTKKVQLIQETDAQISTKNLHKEKEEGLQSDVFDSFFHQKATNNEK